MASGEWQSRAVMVLFFQQLAVRIRRQPGASSGAGRICVAPDQPVLSSSALRKPSRRCVQRSKTAVAPAGGTIAMSALG